MPPSSLSKRATRFRTVDDELIALLQNEEERKNWLFLEPHVKYPGHWAIESFTQAPFFDMREVIGSDMVVSPVTLNEFLDLSDELGYQIAFMEDPMKILEPWEHLSDVPEVEINSILPDTVNGMLPFQVRGFNFLKDLDGGVALWSTGTGKTVLASALIKYALFAAEDPATIVFHVAKAHNKVNAQRALRRLAGIESTVVSGTKQRRRKIYREVFEAVAKEEGGRHAPVLVLNYEKFRTDVDDIKALCADQNVYVVWDEMPNKLKSRTAQVYKRVVECLYTTTPPAVSWHKRRPKKLRQVMLTATPIENSPEDFFNCMRILDPRVFGTVSEFRDEYVASYSYFNEHEPSKWHKLPQMGLQSSHVVHLADKENDPDIKAQFPQAIPETIYVDWDDKDRKIYDLLTKEAAKLDLEEANILSLIGLMQMLCDAPSMVTNSAARREVWEAQHEAWKDAGADPDTEPEPIGSDVAKKLIDALGSHNLTDERHTKLAALRELLCETHPDEKVLVFTALNESIMPVLESKLQEWGVTYRRYSGTEKQRQAAEDDFMTDPDIQVFLSSDMGSDSLNLEAGSVVIHYDLPWKWSTYTQRENRVHRVSSEFDSVRYYTLLMDKSVEDRKVDIIQDKLGFHDAIFNGAIADQAAHARIGLDELRYILFGDDT